MPTPSLADIIADYPIDGTGCCYPNDGIIRLSEVYSLSALSTLVLANQIQEVVAPSQILAVTDAAAVTLTVPPGAVGAIIQVQVTSGTGAVRTYWDGQTATSLLGYRAHNLSEIVLGTIAQLQAASPDELADFSARAETGTAANLYVTYYIPA
jgi:hypothetical protein